MLKDFSTTSFVVGVIIGALLASAWFLGGITSSLVSVGSSAPATTTTTPPTSTTTLPQGTPSGAVSVSDQPAGSSVTIESVTVPPPGVWVAVREVSGNSLGNVLGAARAGGPRTNLSVALLRPTVAGQTYAVELYRDDGNAAFSLDADSVYVDFDSGNRVVAYFKATN